MEEVVVRIDADRRLRIPEEMGEEYSPGAEVSIERCDGGWMIKPLPRKTLAEVFAETIPMRQPTQLDLSDLDMDEMGL